MRTARRDGATAEGAPCLWEAEDVYVDGRPLQAAAPPEGETWCEAAGERSRMVDVLGHEGPYLSVKRTEWSCCPARAVTECVTLDVRTGEPVTLDQVDPARADERWRHALAKGVDGLRRDAFAVGDGHVRFCVVRGDHVDFVEVP